MKNVWILNHYAGVPFGSSGGGTRHFSLARHLPPVGWKASIITASTVHPSGRQRTREGGVATVETIDNAAFLSLPARSYRGNGVDRMLNMFDYTRAALSSKNLRLLERPDAIIGSSVHPLAAWAGRRLARRYNVPFLFEVRDLWPETLIDMGRISRNHPATIVLRALETSLYRSAARIIVLLPSAGDYIEPLGIEREKIVWVPNGVDVENFPAYPVKPTPNKFTLMYFGAHGDANGLDNLLQAMAILRDRPKAGSIRLRLIGDGPLKPDLVELARKLNLPDVSFEPPVAKAAIPKLAAESDALIFNLIDAPVFRFGISSNKLFDYLAAARPVIFCCNSSNNPIEEAGAGLTIPPENPQVLAEAILEMAGLSEAERAAMGAAGRQHLEANYNMKALAAKLASTLDECVMKR